MRPIAITLHVKHLGFIDEPINDGVSNGIVSKDLVKFSEWQVGGCNGPQLCIMSGANNLKEQIAGLCVQCHVSQLVND